MAMSRHFRCQFPGNLHVMFIFCIDKSQSLSDTLQLVHGCFYIF